jgi:hypothetical protein
MRRIVVNRWTAQILLWAVLIAGTVPLPAQVQLQIRATLPGIATPVCVRAEILKSDGEYLEGEWLTSGYPFVELHGKAMAPDTSIEIPAGVTRITVGKGPDYIPQTIITNLTQDTIIELELEPVFDLYGRGWRAADLHVHHIHGEAEIIRTPQEAWTICAAGGLNFVSLVQEHYGGGTMERQEIIDLLAPFRQSECQLVLGAEEPKNAWGHYASATPNPWSIRSAPPYGVGIRDVHEQGGVSVPVHPTRLFPGRYYDDPGSEHRTWFLFPYHNFLKSYPLDALTGHLMDGWSGVSDEAHTHRVLPPYFQLLNSGYRIPLLADSDACLDRWNNGSKAPGFWMTYYYLGDEPVSRAAIAEAMRKGRVMSTTGPLVLFTIDDAIPGDTLPADGSPRTVRIDASYSFNPWTMKPTTFDGSAPCRLTQIDLFRNGQIIESWNPNAPTASVQTVIHETASNAWYMVRVVGNQGQWMAGYASPIYFGHTQPRQPHVFKPLIQGRLYDAATGNALTGMVSCVRYGREEWTIPTDSQGRFQARIPIDAELIAQDSAGRTFMQNILRQESVYAFLHYLADNYSNTMADSISALSNLVHEMRWEFPLGYQGSPSYVRTALDADAILSDFAVVSAPAPTPDKTNAEIAMVLVDKTQVQHGDTVNFAVIFRSPQNPPAELLVVEWRGHNPDRPSMFNKHSHSFGDFNNPATLVNLGDGFYLRAGAVVIPEWVVNAAPSTAAVMMRATVRPPGTVSEDARISLPLGPTRRELLVSTTWDGLPATWGEVGIGPGSFRRDSGFFEVRYADHREMIVDLALDGEPLRLAPQADTAHVADADDAVFDERFYYDGQCEPEFRNIPFRDGIRPQPPPTDFSDVPIADPPDTAPPSVVAIEPANGATVPSGKTFFYFLIDDAGLSGPGSATVFVNGEPVTNSTISPVALSLSEGAHTWHVEGADLAGNTSFSATNAFTVASAPTNTNALSVMITSPTNGAVLYTSNVLVTATTSSDIGIAGVQFQIDGVNIEPELVEPPYEIEVSPVSSGDLDLSALARDTAGNTVTSAVVQITIPELPSPPLTGAFSNGLWQVQFPSDGDWLYVLERSSDLISWEAVTAITGENQTTLTIDDPDPLPSHSFYRVRVQRR